MTHKVNVLTPAAHALPEGQGVGELIPAPGQYDPAVHSEQIDSPVLEVNVPDAHSTLAVSPVDAHAEPAGQVVGAVIPSAAQ